MYLKHQFISFLTWILLCASLSGKSQKPSFYTVTPFQDDDYFTKTVFPFNPAFIKEKRIKSISFKYHAEKGVDYVYDFNSDGLVASMAATHYDKEKTDTVFYTRYDYNTKGQISKKARIDYRDGLVKMSRYRYDEKNRIDIISIFSLNSQMPNRQQNSGWQGEPAPGVDKIILAGNFPDESLLDKMTLANEFSSWRYRYYTKDRFEAEERTEYYDFMKQHNNPDTCAQKETYYYLNGLPVVLFLHTGCAEKTLPSEMYQYKEGLLTEKKDSPTSLELKNEKYSYDKNNNLVLMENIWKGQKVSELIMTYDKKGFLVAIQRKSATAEASHYFQDRALKLTYTFY